MPFAFALRCSFVALLALLPGVLAAQGPAPRPLGTPDAVYSEAFTAISSLRELRDGRVLVSDVPDRALHLVDLTAGTARAVGRQGAGPGEYGSPGRLLVLPGDSTLLWDPMNSRFLTIRPDGTPGATMPLIDPGEHLLLGALAGIDDHGRLYYVVTRRAAGSGGLLSGHEADLVRYERGSGRLDTLATLNLPRGEQTGAHALPGGMLQRFTNLPFAARDVAAVAADGRVAIVRVDGFRVEWVGGGSRVMGPATPFRPIRITEAEKRAFVAGLRQPGQIMVRGGGAGGGVALPRGGGPPPGGGDDLSGMTWPAAKPPFLAGAAQIDRLGRVWVLESRAHDDPIPVHAVLGSRGELIERVSLPRDTRLVGFGAGTVYLSRTDEDGLQYLQRYRR